MTQNGTKTYREQQILNATPAQQIVMLYDGAIGFCLKAKAAIGEGDIQERHNANRRAMEIVNYLLDILDIEKGGDVAKRLYLIYTGLIRKLMDVDFKNDPRVCDDVIENLRTLRTSWAELAATPEGQGNAAPHAGTPAARVGVMPPKILKFEPEDKEAYRPLS
ncbi:MAG: flagellar export chaperone FliS, partial [Alphaproteobacteria bacterium CG_4_10_14_0_8_um_filter_53_9]